MLSANDDCEFVLDNVLMCTRLVLDSWCSGVDHTDGHGEVGVMSSSVYTEVRLILINTAAVVVQMEVR